MITLLALLVGASFVLTVAVTVATAYVLYKYVYLPWKIVRTDITSIYALFNDFKQQVLNELKSRQAIVLNDQAMADAERKGRSQRWLRDLENS